MSNLLDKIEKEIFKLNNQERAFLADRLLGSLENDSMTDVDEAWIAEAESRYQNIRKVKDLELMPKLFLTRLIRFELLRLLIAKESRNTGTKERDRKL